jgi:glycosyltransferase involved in cell wall biosynthesis
MDIHFHHVGTSVYDLKKLAKRYGIEKNLKLWGYREHKKSLQILQKMDALCLILDDRWSRSENTIGGKFYEYLRLKIPILAVVHEKGEAAKLIKKTNSGVIVSAKNQEEVVRALQSLLIENNRFTWDKTEKYTRKYQAAVLNDYLESLI